MPSPLTLASPCLASQLHDRRNFCKHPDVAKVLDRNFKDYEPESAKVFNVETALPKLFEVIFSNEVGATIEGEALLLPTAPFARQPALQQYVWHLLLLMLNHLLRASTAGEHVRQPFRTQPTCVYMPSFECPRLNAPVTNRDDDPHPAHREVFCGLALQVLHLHHPQVEVPEQKAHQTAGVAPPHPRARACTEVAGLIDD